MSDYYVRFHKLRWQLWKRGTDTGHGRMQDEYIDSYISRSVAEAEKLKAENDDRGGGALGWLGGLIGKPGKAFGFD